MKKIGMPLVSIYNKMRMDGLSAADIAKFKGEPEADSSAPSSVDLTAARFKKYR